MNPIIEKSFQPSVADLEKRLDALDQKSQNLEKRVDALSQRLLNNVWGNRILMIGKFSAVIIGIALATYILKVSTALLARNILSKPSM